MTNQAVEMYSRRLNELIEKLQQAGLRSDEVLKIVKALNKSEGGKDIESWFSRAREKALRTRDVLSGSVFVLFIGIMGMITSANGIPAGDIGLSALVSSAALLVCCILSAFYFHKKANSIDRRLDRVLPILSSYWESA
ncbi:MAG TPA: hypothetical protein VIY52_28835 [Streptosporangiaceae bacterium]